MFSRKFFFAALGGVTAGAAGVAMQIFGVTLVFVLGLAVAVVSCAGVASYLVNTSEMFWDVPTPSRKTIVWLISGAATVNALFSLLWGVTTSVTPALVPMWMIVLFTLIATEYGVARLNERVRADKERLRHHRAEKQAQQPAGSQVVAQSGELLPPNSSAAEQQPDNVVLHFRQALRKIKLQYLIVNGWTSLADESGPFGVNYRVRVPAEKLNADGKAALTSGHAEPIAAALTEVLIENSVRAGLPVPDAEILTEWIGVTKQRGAGSYVVTVVNEDVMARVFGYVDEYTDDTKQIPRSRSIHEEALVGYSLDAMAYYKSLLLHESFVGETRSGKSSLLHALLAHTTACTDEIDWICGVEKLYDLIGPWCEVYRRTGKEIPFDWIACGPAHSASMLSLAMSIARWRQRQPMNKRQGFVDLIVWLDEATFTLMNKRARAVYDGNTLDASELTENGVKGGGSAGVWFKLAAQRGTIDNWGSRGGGIAANLQDKSVFQSGDKDELGRAMQDWSLKEPTNKGEYWFKGGGGKLPTRLKAPYVQTDDPQQPVLLPNGPRISEIAWSRRHIQKGFDPATAEAIPSMQYGQLWEQRHRLAEGVLEYVTGTQQDNADDDEVVSDEDQAAINEALAEVAAIDQKHGYTPQIEAVPSEPTPTVPAPAPEPERPKSRKERIYAIVQSSEEPLSRMEIVGELDEQYDDRCSKQIVTNALGDLVNEGRLSRTDEQQQRYTTELPTPVS